MGSNSLQRRLWAWKFSGAETHGIGARIAAMESGHHNLHADLDEHKAVQHAYVEDMNTVRLVVCEQAGLRLTYMC